MFKTILIANRGEIACRIIRTAKKFGYRTVAVYSEADAQALHVQQADFAVCIGPAPANESYLNITAIIQAAKISGAEAIHPGYGFLSENAAFAQACAIENIIFIGPSASAIELMGNKRQAKIVMKKAKVPCVPGYDEADQSNKALTEAAQEIGFPLMIKAAAGGGGRGMRLVSQIEDFQEQLITARKESLNAFGSEEMILEKAIRGGRHIEVQIMADMFGSTIYLGERDCSSQRRHQKVIEEAPSPAVNEKLRQELGEAAVRAAKSCNYIGAGTIEFLLDAEQNFYFLEMNTRLQVEHPVTEMITGLDLVSWQLQIAQGEKLPLTQAEIQLTGHAIEARIYAEDPNQNFLPQTGTILNWKPVEGEFIRVDHGIAEGQIITAYYDPMLAKIIVHGRHRAEAIRLLRSALEKTSLLGITYNKNFLLALLDHPTFIQGHMTTDFIGQRLQELITGHKPQPLQLAIAALLFTKTKKIQLKIFCDQEYLVRVEQRDNQNYLCSWENNKIELTVLDQENDSIKFIFQNQLHKIPYIKKINHIFLDSVSFINQTALKTTSESTQTDGIIRSPTEGTIVKIAVDLDDFVEKGDLLLTVEAMKIQHSITAPMKGRIIELPIKENQTVKRNQLLMCIEPYPI